MKKGKIEKGRQWKEDKQVEKERKTEFPFNFYIVAFADGEKEKRPLKSGVQFFNTGFKNPNKCGINAEILSQNRI